jgi:hypothetical protein
MRKEYRNSLKVMIHAPAIMSVLLLVACDDYSEDKFEVGVNSIHATSATLAICGSRAPMGYEEHVFVASRVISCEGSGVIEVVTPQGIVRCQIGYVTPGAGPRRWRFVVRERGCAPI